MASAAAAAYNAMSLECAAARSQLEFKGVGQIEIGVTMVVAGIGRWVGGMVLASAAIFLLSGCNRGPDVVQVRGKVLYKDGTPIKGGARSIRFEPTEDSNAEISRVAASMIEDDGSFELSRRKPGDGVYLGKYAVVVTAWKGARDPVSLIKDEYTQSATTPFHVTIEGDVDDLKFEIEPLQ